MRATIGTDADEAAERLRRGEVVALPTETVYGLGGNGLDPGAVARIFAVKERPAFDPLILHQCSAERALAYAERVPEGAQRFADRCWPGPLTLVLRRREVIPDIVTSGLPTVALRVPAHPLMRRVLEQVAFPVAAPSANPFGFVSPTTAEHVADQLGDRIDYILDGGPCRIGLESTIVTFDDAGEPMVLRKGGTTVEALEAVWQAPIAVNTHGSSRPQAPGMLSSHYAPGIPLRLVDGEAGPGTARHACVRFGRTARNAYEYSLSESGDLEEAARRLFTLLRRLASEGYAAATVERVPDRGLGRAINDRLERAAR